MIILYIHRHMKCTVIILLLLLQFTCLAQKVQLIVPGQPVIVGTAFQVQYVITNPGELLEASQPIFDSCQVISGPNVYRGDALIDGRLQPIENITYTLQPKTVGVLRIGAITVMSQELNDPFLYQPCPFQGHLQQNISVRHSNIV